MKKPFADWCFCLGLAILVLCGGFMGVGVATFSGVLAWIIVGVALVLVGWYNIVH